MHSDETATEPVDESDPFCTCPNHECGMLGNHGVVVQKLTGDWWAVRTCWSCEHEWRTAAEKPPGPVDINDPLADCPGCGVYGSHPLEVVTLDSENPVTTFLGKPVGAWSISGPDGTEVAIHQCRFCSLLWHTEDD